MKMWKVYDKNNDDDDNNDGQRTNFEQKSSLEPSAFGSGEVMISRTISVFIKSSPEILSCYC